MKVLHILHNGPYKRRSGALGGTELHVQDLMQASDRIDHWSLVPYNDYYCLNDHASNKEFILKKSEVALKDILHPEVFTLVHLHHKLGFSSQDLTSALLKHSNFIVSVHDFHMICPRINLITPDNKLCSLQECCTTCYQKPLNIENLRKNTTNLLKKAVMRICFSESSKNVIEKTLNEHFDWTLIPHGINDVLPFSNQREAPPPNQNNPLKIAFLGTIGVHKGLELIKQLGRTTKIGNDVPLEWHLIGEALGPISKSIHNHGPYERANLNTILSKISPHLVMILSTTPESYCYTLDEALNNQIPVIVSPIGAVAERTLKNKTGWVLEELTKEATLTKIRHLLAHWEEHQNIKNNISRLELGTSRQEAEFYEKLYLQNMAHHIGCAEEASFFSYLSGMSHQTPRASIITSLKRIIRNLAMQTSRLLPKELRKKCLQIKSKLCP